MPSRLPSSLSQFEEAIGDWRGGGCGDSEPLVDGFQTKAAVEAPGEGAEVTWQMFGADLAMGGQEAVLDIGQHRVRPAEGRVARRPAIGAGDVALMDDARLFGDAAKPLAAIADDGGSGLDSGAQALGFNGPEATHHLQASVERPSVIGGLDRDDKRGVAATAAPGPFAGALATDVSVVDLDPRSGGAELVTTVTLEHGLHQLVLKPPSGVGRDPKPPAQLDVGDALLALAKQMHGAEPHPHWQLGALQNGAGDQRRLIPASPALKQLTALDLAILCRRAPWTLEALRPAPGKPRLPACLLVRITLLERIVREALLVLYAVARHCFTLKIIVFSG